MAVAMFSAISLGYMYLLALFISIFFLRACRLFLLIKTRGRRESSTHNYTDIIDDNDMKQQQQQEQGQQYLSIDINNNVNDENKGKEQIDFAVERERRNRVNELYATLRKLVPSATNTTKYDRTSVVEDTVDHIRELVGTIGVLKLLVMNTKYKFKQEGDNVNGIKADRSMKLQPSGTVESDGLSSLAISVKRTSKSCKVRVRFNGEEATIKMVQKDKIKMVQINKINCFPAVSKVLDELQLDLHQVVSFHVHCYSKYLCKTKNISEGASVCASDIASKLIEVMGRRNSA